MSSSYQAETRISVDDVHYAPLAPGERELKILGDVRGKRVLELACGAAQNAIAVSKRGARAAALDISALQLSQARRLIAEEGVQVDLLRGDMEHLCMFRDECFDVLMSSFGWEFVPDDVPPQQGARIIHIAGQFDGGDHSLLRLWSNGVIERQEDLSGGACGTPAWCGWQVVPDVPRD